MVRGKNEGKYSSRLFRCMVWLLICMFFLPAPMSGLAAPSDAAPWNRHVYERLNSPERARAIEEAARLEAAARKAYAQSETAAPAASVSRERTGQPSAFASGESAAVSADASHTKSVTEVLFNYAAGFAGVPGLAPRQGIDGSLDEGLGFHQDGTARKAGGVAGSSGPSSNGYRARTYMQSGLNAYGQGYAGLYAEMYNDLWGNDGSTRGGRVSSSSGYSRELGDFNLQDMLIDKGLNWGSGFVNSMGEAAISGLVDGGRARLNFRLDKDGYFSGEGDALLPFYDGKYTTVYTQLGARSMYDSKDTRWIGNFGLGQRWFPFAQGEDVKSADYDAGNLMLGYNAFFDYDLTRDHQRGGFGAELQYDWLRLSSNYYFPLSSWRGSEDFDSRFVKERPAEGWDARVKAYLPFYRNVAITGAYSQWYGDHVGMFGSDNLEKDPRVWSYGVEYTPVPLVSGFITQKSTERGRTDTEFGLTFTYHFGMPWEDQISHSRVAELRTVDGSRHEFVDRENRIILEYKAQNAYRIEYLGFIDGQHQFRLRDGFNKTASGRTATITSLSGAVLIGGVSSLSASTNGSGVFGIELAANAPDPTTVTIQAGSNSQTFNLAGGSAPLTPRLRLNVVYNRPSFVTSDFSATATITATATDGSGNSVTINAGDVTWTVENSSITAAWWGNRSAGDMNGLTWGSVPLSLNAAESAQTAVSGTYPTGDTADLTDIVGSRTVTVKAVMTINGTQCDETITVSFGDGPLSVFANYSTGTAFWADTTNINTASSFPAAAGCGGTIVPGAWGTKPNGDWASSSDYPSVFFYATGSNLPTHAQLMAVAGYHAVNNPSGKGAALAAGWAAGDYWTGEAIVNGTGARTIPIDGNGLSFTAAGSTASGINAVCLH